MENSKTNAISQDTFPNTLSAFFKDFFKVYFKNLGELTPSGLSVFMICFSTALHRTTSFCELPTSVSDLTPANFIWCSLGLALEEGKQSVPAHLLHGTYENILQVISLLECKPLAYAVIPSTETISCGLERERWSLTTTASCCHNTMGLRAVRGCNGVLGHVRGGESSRRGGQGQPGLWMPSRPWCFQKVYCTMAFVLEILTNIFWNPRGDRGVRERECHEMLNIWQSESHDLGPFSCTESHWNTD